MQPFSREGHTPTLNYMCGTHNICLCSWQFAVVMCTLPFIASAAAAFSALQSSSAYVHPVWAGVACFLLPIYGWRCDQGLQEHMFCDMCCDMCCTELYHVLANHVYLEQWPRTKQQCHNGGWRECMKHIAVSDQRSVETSTLHRIYPYQRCILCGGNRQFAIDWPGQSAVNEEAFNQLCSVLTCQHVPVAETAFSEHISCGCHAKVGGG
jgi:hypothetical protein